MTREDAKKIILKHQFAFASLPDEVVEAVNYLINEDQETILDKIKQAKEIMANKAHADADGEIVVDISDALNILSELVISTDLKERKNKDE